MSANRQLSDSERLRRWRLVLGEVADTDQRVPLSGEDISIDAALSTLYDADDKGGGLAQSSPRINRWLGDIRRYFPTPVVQLLQRDALERLDIKRMLLEPELLEQLQPDVHLAAMLLQLKDLLPEQTRVTARVVVQRVTDEVTRKLSFRMQAAFRGALRRRPYRRRPRVTDIDWHRTLRANLKNYRPQLSAVIPEHLIGLSRKQRQARHIILLVDQSASMATSVVYAGILGSILASLPSIRTHFVAFDTGIADLSPLLQDPVDVLFAGQLGGGTDIAQALQYGRSLITQPEHTLVVLLSDLYEGGSPDRMLRHCAAIKMTGARMISLLALSDEGAPDYDQRIARKLAAIDVPTFACTPDEFADVVVQYV